jgi:hypothetical protein
MNSYVKHLAAFICVLALASLCNAQDFKQVMKQAFGNDYRDYQWLDYPVNNFGVATAYTGVKDRVDRRGFLCATFTCLGVKQSPADIDVWMRANDFADVGCGGQLDAKLERNKGSILNSLLPKILNVVGLTASLGTVRNIKADIKLASMCSRQLQQAKMIGFIKGLNAENDTFGLKQAYDRGRLVLVIGDLVMKSMTIRLYADNKLNAQLDAKLGGESEKVLGQGAEFGVKISKSSSKDYELTVTDPVIVAVLAVRAGDDKTRANGTSWEGWEPVTIRVPLPIVRAKRTVAH